MSAKFFLDTHILVYTLVLGDANRKQRAVRLVGEALEEGQGMISFQVVQEFLNTVLHKNKDKHHLSWNELNDHYETVLGPLCRVYPNAQLYQKALQIHRDTNYRFYDSLIVASAIDGGCKVLYSEDFQDGQRIGGLTIKNPFAE